MTARDVAFSLERAASPKAFANVGLSIISSTKVVNARTIDVNVKQVSAPFLSDLALWPASVLDEKVFKKDGEAKFKDHPIGSGPFSVASFKPGDEIVLKKNPHWWDTDSCGNHYPYLNEVVLKYIPNDNTRVTALQGGQLDGIFNVPYNEVASLNSGDITSTVTPQLGGDLLALSQKVPAFRNTDVIQAIDYAVNRDAIVKSVFSGNARPAESPLFPGVYYATTKYGYAYNLAKAKKLMHASGFKSFSATVTVPAGDAIGAAIAQIFQSEMRAIGGKISIQQVDSTTLQNEQSKGTLQISWTALTSDILDPSENALFCWVSNGGANANYTGWKSAKVQRLLPSTGDAERRASAPTLRPVAAPDHAPGADHLAGKPQQHLCLPEGHPRLLPTADRPLRAVGGLEGLAMACPPLEPGVWQILLTPFRGADLRVDHDSLRRVVGHAQRVGVTALVALGVLGEASSLTSEERSEVLETVVAEAGCLPVVAGAFPLATAPAAEEARRAAAAARQR